MAPKQKPKVTIHIDPNKHNEQLKEIERNIMEEAAAREAAEAAEAGEFSEPEYMDEEGEEEMLSEPDIPIEPSIDVGRIDISFPETGYEFANSPECYPPSYYTHSPKERLMLLFAENFRKQFCYKYPSRRPLILAPLNECNVQKFVCATIRPTAFVHIPLISNEEGIAKFVADFIIYEPLEDILSPPPRLISPASLLRQRRGNSFEMATLLCSLLIGARFPAMVVSGVARHNIIMNNTTSMTFPYKIEDFGVVEEVESKNVKCLKYKLRPLPDIQSHLEEILLKINKEKALEEQLRMEKRYQEIEERNRVIPVDKCHFRRTHAWVLILDNAPWSVKPKKTYINELGEEVESPPTPYFIEPATGFVYDINCKEYILIDSVWNDRNYYVNKQNYQRLSEIRWNFSNTDDWEHLLPGQPRETRKLNIKSDENIVEFPIKVEKNLDVIQSWVMRLHIGDQEFEERFPNLQKIMHFKGVVHEQFSPYAQRDGKIEQFLIFADDSCTKPLLRYEYYKNRSDKLEKIKYDHETSTILEVFGTGRNDNLHYMEHKLNVTEDKRLYFYSESRIDSLKYMEVRSDSLLLKYGKRIDFCIFHEFEFKPNVHVLKKITEKFRRNPEVPHYHDISQRTFILRQRKIALKYHYAPGALTASTREFIKPPKPNYGQELKYDPSLTKAYKGNPEDPPDVPLDLYLLLLDQLKQEEKVVKLFEKVWDEMNATLDLRVQEIMNPILTFSIFDPLRNGAARAIHVKQYEEEEAHKLDVMNNPPDFLAPYLVAYEGHAITAQESYVAFTSCLNDLRTRFINLLNDLQRKYEDLTSESKALQRFLNKFQDQFNNYDYERLVNEAKSIELNKRMIQQRLTLTHEESQKKYEMVKESLLTDPRLKITTDLINQVHSKGY